MRERAPLFIIIARTGREQRRRRWRIGLGITLTILAFLAAIIAPSPFF